MDVFLLGNIRKNKNGFVEYTHKELRNQHRYTQEQQYPHDHTLYILHILVLCHLLGPGGCEIKNTKF